MNILMDSGYLIELFGKGRKYHQTAKDVWEVAASHQYRLHTLWECLAEASHKLTVDGRCLMLRWLAREGVTIHTSSAADMLAMADYMAQYASTGRGDGADITDVAVVFLAERLKTAHIFTVDRNDFAAYRTRQGKPFKVLWLTEAHEKLKKYWPKPLFSGFLL